jgi:DNA-directed RNA polymerase subunit RPC12/RpoP
MTQTCSRCKRVFRVPDDECGDHACPACSFASVYRIRPLEWTFYEHIQRWDAETIFCTLYVESNEDGTFSWRFCVDEFYDEGQESCESFDDGKLCAEAWYLARLMPALESCAANSGVAP